MKFSKYSFDYVFSNWLIDESTSDVTITGKNKWQATNSEAQQNNMILLLLLKPLLAANRQLWWS